MGLTEADLFAFSINANTIPNYLSHFLAGNFNRALYLMKGGF